MTFLFSSSSFLNQGIENEVTATRQKESSLQNVGMTREKNREERHVVYTANRPSTRATRYERWWTPNGALKARACTTRDSRKGSGTAISGATRRGNEAVGDSGLHQGNECTRLAPDARGVEGKGGGERGET